jgi:hypothetical protein
MLSGGTQKNALSQKRLALEQQCLGSFCSPRNDNQNDDIALPDMRVFQKIIFNSWCKKLTSLPVVRFSFSKKY